MLLWFKIHYTEIRRCIVWLQKKRRKINSSFIHYSLHRKLFFFPFVRTAHCHIRLETFTASEWYTVFSDDQPVNVELKTNFLCLHHQGGCEEWPKLTDIYISQPYHFRFGAQLFNLEHGPLPRLVSAFIPFLSWPHPNVPRLICLTLPVSLVRNMLLAGINLDLSSRLILLEKVVYLLLLYLVREVTAQGVRFPVLTAATMKIRAFWNLAPSSLVVVDRRFRSAYCLHHQDYHRNISYYY
jgi:hypothetical protein